MSLINFYNPCKPLILSEIEGIINKVTSPIIWVGNFNAHNPLWGSQQRDANGAVLEEFLDSCNLVTVNDNRPTRVEIKSGNMSCLDLTLSPALASVGEWKVLV